MTTRNPLRIHSEHHALGYRCRACGHVSDPAPDHDAHAPGDSRCAGCGVSIPQPGGSVGVAQIERHFEPLIWWDELAA